MSEPSLFDLADYPKAEKPKKYLTSETPIWTCNKAKFIARYLKAFTYVTKHGSYIDAFAGPQHETTSEISWAAKLVMENEPAWLRHFYLFDRDPAQVTHLQGLKESYLGRQKDAKKRSVHVGLGDCNQELPSFLSQNPIKEKEATFCLLDQRSTECDWKTVKFVSGHKGSNGGNKIELFYFLAQGWIDRAIKSWRIDVEERCERWFGKQGVREFLALSSHERGRTMAQRFKEELGYAHSFAFPIQQSGRSGRIMFWMIHATDHERAPALMWQAYRHIGAGGGINDPLDQLQLGLE